MQRSAWGLAALLLVGVAGCRQATPEPAKSVLPTPATSGAVGKPALHPCALLSDAEVTGAVAGAEAGQHDTGDEGYGIYACRWKAGDGTVMLQAFDAGPGALAQELRASSLEIVEMRRPDAAGLVRLERFDGIGDMAGAYVERADPKRGIARSSAVLMVQRGGRLAVLRIPQLADGDRDRALQTLRALGTSIAKGL